nr:MAG TPA: hypothetical protein [Caudoviricetes sp.]
MKEFFWWNIIGALCFMMFLYRFPGFDIGMML